MGDLESKGIGIRQATYLLISCVTLLLTFGSVMLYSASMHQEGSFLLIKHLVYASMGLGGAVILAWKDYQWLRKHAVALFMVAVVLLGFIFVFGEVRNNARRWFVFGDVISFQPSEFAKLALVIFLAYYGEKNAEKMGSWGHGLLLPLIPVGLLLGLIFSEPDRGTTVLLAALTGVLLLLSGSRWSGFVILFLIGVAGLAYIFSTQATPGERFMAWLDPEKHKEDHAYQIWQSLLAFGSGGLEGMGLGSGRIKINFLPEQQTDFIFAVIGEEMGLLISIGVVIVFMIFVLTGLFIAWNARDRFGFLMAAGVTFLIGLQALINMAVVTNTLPNKGLSLPFISYGGSNLLFMMAGVGVLVSVANHSLKTYGMKVPEQVESNELFQP
ncbi:MAG: FtsW/RodA/SpoVE family cell cycle protein [Limisphaerales bacterium]|jgi:cell division protein FtsW